MGRSRNGVRLLPKKNGFARGETLLDAETERLVRDIGRDKLAPDTSAEEIYYSRSLKIRRKIAEFLIENEGSYWHTLEELWARAANYAGCAEPTARRWVFQFTRVGTSHDLRMVGDYWMLEART